jgi:hypothetical protein
MYRQMLTLVRSPEGSNRPIMDENERSMWITYNVLIAGWIYLPVISSKLHS